MSVPVPVLVSASVPVVFWIAPEKLPEALPAPTVSVGVPPPATLSITPAPLRPLIVSLKVFRSSVPATLRLPLPVPSGMTLAAPSCSVPPVTVVSPA